MGESFRNQELLLVVFGKGDAIPLAIGGTVLSEINSHIKHRTPDSSDKLALRIVLLKVQTSEHTLGALGLVILNEVNVEASFLHILLIVCFHEIAAGISMYGWCNHTQTFNAANILLYFDLSHLTNSPHLIHQYSA